MAKKAKELQALAVSRIKSVGMNFVGGVDGLALQVTESGAKSWILRVMVAGKRRHLGLGGYPAVTLKGAQEAARAARVKIRAGIEPYRRRPRSQKSACSVSCQCFDLLAMRHQVHQHQIA